MTMKSTLIVPITLLATLAAGVLVHDRLRTKPSFEDAAPTRTGSIATAHPDAPAPVSPAPVSAPACPPARPPRGRGSDANRIDCDGQARCPGAWEPGARFGPGARHARARAAAAHDHLARGEPRRVDDQDLSRVLEAGGSAHRRRSLYPAGAPQFQTRRIAPEAAEARQSAVRSGAKAAGKERVAGGQGMRPFTDAGSISLLL